MGKFVITEKGKALQAKVFAGKCKYAFTKIAVGNGTSTSSDDYVRRNDLVAPKANIPIKSVTVDGAECEVKGLMTNSDIDEAFYVREVGLFAEDPDNGEIMFCAHYYDMPMPIDAASSGSYTKEFTFRTGIESADNVNVTVSPAGIATQAQIDKVQAQIDKVPAQIDKAQAQIVDDYKSSLIALLPAHYARSVEWSGSKSSIIVPSYLTVNIGNQGYVHNGDRTIDITQPASWDDATLADAANRKGKDFYIYACRPADGTSVPHLILSANSTVPNGYTATNSRKIGGFHCLCADVGTISDNLMSGYSAGDIIPTTLWDLKHRPVSPPEGMFYANGRWFDIYLCSWDGSKLVSKYNAVVADGESTKRFSGIGFAEELAKIGKHLPSYDDFVHFAKGVPELLNIKGSADPNTTGGHVNTDNQRIISSYGAEDVAGVQWQFLSDLFGSDFSSNWNHDSVYNNRNLGIDVDRGSCYGGGLRRLLAGGLWVDGSNCGSRAANVDSWAAVAWGNLAARGSSEPLAVGL